MGLLTDVITKTTVTPGHGDKLHSIGTYGMKLFTHDLISSEFSQKMGLQDNAAGAFRWHSGLRACLCSD